MCAISVAAGVYAGGISGRLSWSKAMVWRGRGVVESLSMPLSQMATSGREYGEGASHVAVEFSSSGGIMVAEQVAVGGTE